MTHEPSVSDAPVADSATGAIGASGASGASERSAAPGRNPWERYGWVVRGVWLVFLIFPVLSLVTVARPWWQTVVGLAAGTTFNSNYTGTTSLTYKVRTTKVGGSGAITLKVTTDFGPAGGPSVATPPTAGDTLAYTCTLTSPGTACSGSQTASTAAGTPVGTFGADAKSASAGNGGTVAWTLTNDPQYSTGTYTAIVTFTISAT